MSGRKIECEFCFHGIGQGLFYTGCVGDLVFAYDCGSIKEQDINTAVEIWCKLKGVKKLQFLFLSHLHWDHVSGVKTLLELAKVDTVILPYLDPWERLLIACLRIKSPAWYFIMLYDPVNFFLNYGVRRIILVARGVSNDITNIDFDRGRREHQYANQFFIDMSQMPELDDETKERIFDREIAINRHNNWREIYKNGILLLKSHFGIIDIVNHDLIWKFILYNCTVDDSQVNIFKNKVMTEFKCDHKEISLDIFKNKQNLKKLKDCYKNFIKSINGSDDLNWTSLVLWHGPLNDSKFKIKWKYCIFFSSDINSTLDKVFHGFINDVWTYDTNKPQDDTAHGCFLTGDLPLGQNQTYVEIGKYFGSILASTAICLVPHHGSIKNWNKTIMEELKFCKKWVVSAGLKNNYGHPHKKVFQDLIEEGNIVFWAHEKQGFRYKF